MSLGAILPLSIRGSYDVDDLSRARLLFRTLERFSPPGLFRRFLVAMPDAEVAVGEKELARWRHLGVEVVPEESLLPSFRRFPRVRGWRKQQLLKLAAARALESPFYITFDADVIATKSLEEKALLPGGRALTQYCYLEEHPRWWRSSARILAMPEKRLAKLKLGLHATPVIMSRTLCCELMRNLAVGCESGRRSNRSPRASSQESWDVQLLRLHGGVSWTPRGISRWRMRKWTEYSLYYLFGLQSGLWSKYHTEAGRTNGELETPVFRYIANEEFDAEYVATHFSHSDRPPFAVVGTKGVLPPELVVRELAPYLGPSSG